MRKPYDLLMVTLALLFSPSMTPLENSLRRSGGEAGYSGGFIQHYIQPVLYPAGLTRGTQLVLGSLALLINLAAYGVVVARRKRFPK